MSLINTIIEGKTPFDKILHTMQENELYILLSERENMELIKPYNEEKIHYYTKPNNGIFYKCPIQKLIQIRRIINFVCRKFNNNDSSLILFKNDALVDVFVLKYCVIKFYDVDKYKLLQPIFNTNHPNLEKVLWKQLFPNFGVVVSEKLKIIDKIQTTDIDTLEDHICSALKCLNKLGFIHGDTRIDNIGIDNSGNYVLFDFGFSNKIQSLKQKRKDYATLQQSVYYHLFIKT